MVVKPRALTDGEKDKLYIELEKLIGGGIPETLRFKVQVDNYNMYPEKLRPDRIAEPEHDLSILPETREILRNLLELIEGEDERHFKAMAALVTPPALAPAAAVP